jgi:hypothetical protein
MQLRQLFEAKKKTAVIAFGRLNPPTIGHAKLVDAIKSQEGDHYLFLSQSQKPKTDPLDFATKVRFAKQFFPGINIGHESVRTPVDALQMMQKLGYTDVVFLAGSDRVEGFQKLFDTYNGKEDKKGNIPFKFNTINVISAGDRDPDADDVSGMSASKMRAAAAAGDLEVFAQGVPDAKLAKTMYNAVRNGMGIKDVETAEDVSPEDEDKFHNELDDLVHKYFGDSPDEEKMKKKYNVKEEPVDEDLVVPRAALRGVIKDLISKHIDQENDIDKLSYILKSIVGKTVKHRGSRYQITSEDIVVALENTWNKMYTMTGDKSNPPPVNKPAKTWTKPEADAISQAMSDTDPGSKPDTSFVGSHKGTGKPGSYVPGTKKTLKNSDSNLRQADQKTAAVKDPKTGNAWNPYSPNPKNAPKKKDPVNALFKEKDAHPIDHGNPLDHGWEAGDYPDPGTDPTEIPGRKKSNNGPRLKTTDPATPKNKLKFT